MAKVPLAVVDFPQMAPVPVDAGHISDGGRMAIRSSLSTDPYAGVPDTRGWPGRDADGDDWAKGADSLGAILDARCKGAGTQEPSRPHRGQASGRTTHTAMKKSGPTTIKPDRWQTQERPLIDALRYMSANAYSNVRQALMMPTRVVGRVARWTWRLNDRR